MPRRKIMLLAAAVVAALGLGCYLPQYFSPVPDLMAEIKSCLDPTGDDVNSRTPTVDPLQEIRIQLSFIGFNTSRTGTTLLADAGNEGRPVTGRVKDYQRLQIALRRLGEERCVSRYSRPAITNCSGSPSFVSFGQGIEVVSAGDGASREWKLFGETYDVLASLRRDGRIDLHLEMTVSEPKGMCIGPGGAVACRELEVVTAKTTVVLNDGQTCFIGGVQRRAKGTETYRLPLASELPAIGSWFEVQQEVEFDEELLILATPTLGPPR